LLLREEIHVARELGGEVPHALASSLLRQTILADISGCTPEQLARQTPTEATSQRFQPFSFSAVIARGAPVAFTSRIVSIAVSAAIYPSVRPLSSTWLAGRKNVSPPHLDPENPLARSSVVRSTSASSTCWRAVFRPNDFC
jgi:hypothetical protein